MGPAHARARSRAPTRSSAMRTDLTRDRPRVSPRAATRMRRETRNRARVGGARSCALDRSNARVRTRTRARAWEDDEESDADGWGDRVRAGRASSTAGGRERDDGGRGARDGGRARGGPDDGFGARRGFNSARRRARVDGERPDVWALTQRDYERVLPIGATGEQYGYFWGDSDVLFQRAGLSLLVTVLTVNNFPYIAVPACTFFLWAPVALAARRNSKVRSAKYAGLWRAKVLACEPIETRGTSSVDWMFNLLIGDDSGARVPLKVPLKAEYADINVGEDVELIVTSDDPDFYTFQAIREAYLPYLDVWVGEYPFLERRGMINVSDRIASGESRESA